MVCVYLNNKFNHLNFARDMKCSWYHEQNKCCIYYLYYILYCQSSINFQFSIFTYLGWFSRIKSDITEVLEKQNCSAPLTSWTLVMRVQCHANISKETLLDGVDIGPPKWHVCWAWHKSIGS